MKVSPKVSLLSTNEDTENNQDVYDVYLALKLNYFNRMFELSKMEMHNDLEYKSIKPCKNLSDFVDSFWCMKNKSDQTLETIGLPDGRIDLSLILSCI